MLQHQAGPRRGEVFRIGIAGATARQDRQARNVGGHHTIAHIKARIGDGIDQARTVRQAERRQDREARHVEVDQHDIIVLFRRNRHRQIDGTERLAFLGMGRGHHDALSCNPGALTAQVFALFQQLALDDAELLQLGAGPAAGGDETFLHQPLMVDPVEGLVRRLSRGVLRLRGIALWRGILRHFTIGLWWRSVTLRSRLGRILWRIDRLGRVGRRVSPRCRVERRWVQRRRQHVDRRRWRHELTAIEGVHGALDQRAVRIFGLRHWLLRHWVLEWFAHVSLLTRSCRAG